MRTIIAGTRSITDAEQVRKAIWDSRFDINEVVCGCADGVDKLGFDWARRHNLPVNFFPAWISQYRWALENRKEDEHVQNHFEAAGKRAGMARNGQMAFYADALVLIWDGQSKGSADMLRRATTLERKVYVHRV